MMARLFIGGQFLGPEGLAAYQTLKSIYQVGPSD
jgi:hypothetical protein